MDAGAPRLEEEAAEAAKKIRGITVTGSTANYTQTDGATRRRERRFNQV